MKILPFSIPTPFPVGPINIYLIREDPLTLIDTGPKTEEALEALRHQLRLNGLVVSDIERIILTHTHEDHCGLAGVIQRESGARVHVHRWESGNISQERHSRVDRELLERVGVPGEQIDLMAARYKLISRYADPVEDIEPFDDGAEFIFAAGSWRAIHTPGHTPGSSCLFREANRVMIAGDTILKTITPNPVLSADPLDRSKRFPSLGEYLVSLARIRRCAPTLLLTAHGREITDYEEHFHGLVRHLDNRLKKVIGLVPADGITAWELSHLLYPNSGVDDVNRFLAVSATIANLDLAVAEGKLRREKGPKLDHFLPC